MNPFDLALEHQRSGRYADAARLYQGLLDRNPDDPDALHLFGVLHQQCGHSGRAVELIGHAIALRPDAAAFHSNLAEAYRALKQLDRAAECCRTALALQPEYPEAVNNLGLVLHDLGRDEEALGQFDAALRMRPDFASAQNNRGTSLRALGRVEEATEAYRQAVRLDPGLALARANLGQTLTDRREPGEALPHCQEAVRLRPDLPAAHNNLGNALLALERWDEATGAFNEAVRLEPGLAVAHANLGVARQQAGRLDEALRSFRRAVELAPDEGRFHQQLASAHALEDDWGSAVLSCEARVRVDPESADAHSELGWAYLSDDRPVEAEAAFRRALGLQPDHLDALLNLGALQEELGRMADALASYHQAEAAHPVNPLPLARRALLDRNHLPEGDRDRLRFHLYQPLDPSSRMNCLFALSHVADARGDYAESAACLKPANALAKQQRRASGQEYDPQLHTRYVDSLIAGFTPTLFEKLGGAGDDSRRPVFVFGMPRSGTTLVEQVLASHSLVHGAGELTLVRRAMDSFPPSEERPWNLGAALMNLGADDLRRLARQYGDGVLARLDRQKPGADPARVVDKMPENYLYLGLIALLFPNATLIHVRRDLRDVALSCWMTQFRSLKWAEDTDDLAGRCRNYLRITDHWRSVLPRPIHEVHYESLVNDFEGEARRLLAACGLSWEPGCLDFHKTERAVRTASVTQVRQPIYRKSLARWKAYQPYLSSLFDQLPQG